MTRAKRLAIRLPDAAAPATEAPRAASQRYPITVNAHVTAQIAAGSHAATPHHLMAAPPVENRTAAATTLDLGVMGARNILPLRWRFRCLASERARTRAPRCGSSRNGASRCTL